MLDVDALVADRSFGLSYLAGRTGGIRPVSWVHVVDLEDPWNWVGPGDLLLTTGPGIPPPAEQRDWLSAVITSGVSGLVVAPRPGVHELGPEAVSIADDASFPVLAASFDLKFVDLARRVIDDTLRREGRRMAAVHRVFDTYSTSLSRTESLDERLRSLCRSVALEFELFDDSGTRIAGTVSITSFDDSTTILTLKPPMTPFRAELRLRTRDGARIDPALEHSFSTIVVLELQQHARDHRAAAAAARYVVEDVISGVRPEAALADALEERGHDRAVQMVATAVQWDADGADERGDARVDLSAAPALWGAPVLGAWQDETFIMFCSADPALLSDLRERLGAGARIGLSEPVSLLNPPQQAARQARIALASARPGAPRTFAPAAVTAIVPTAPDECRLVAEHYLSPLLSHDRAHDATLLDTVRTYLRRDRSAAAAAAELHIHRHTLMYRLRTVAKISGLDPTTSAGTAMLWVAFEAADRAGWPER